MSVRVADAGVIELFGRCGVEDAELLQRQLLAVPGSTVEWTDCEFLHTAVVQVLLVGKPPLRGQPKTAFLRTHVAPILDRAAKYPHTRASEARR
jgi:hypothetical protein